MHDKEFTHGSKKLYYGDKLVTRENFEEIFSGEHFVTKFNWFIENQDITYEWIDEFRDLLSWRQLAFHYKFTEDFIRRYFYDVWYKHDMWCCLTEYQIRNFSISFIREFAPWFSWFHIKKYHLKKLGKDFEREFWPIMEHIDASGYINY